MAASVSVEATVDPLDTYVAVVTIFDVFRGSKDMTGPLPEVVAAGGIG